MAAGKRPTKDGSTSEFRASVSDGFCVGPHRARQRLSHALLHRMDRAHKSKQVLVYLRGSDSRGLIMYHIGIVLDGVLDELPHLFSHLGRGEAHRFGAEVVRLDKLLALGVREFSLHRLTVGHLRGDQRGDQRLRMVTRRRKNGAFQRRDTSPGPIQPQRRTPGGSLERRDRSSRRVKTDATPRFPCCGRGDKSWPFQDRSPGKTQNTAAVARSDGARLTLGDPRTSPDRKFGSKSIH